MSDDQISNQSQGYGFSIVSGSFFTNRNIILASGVFTTYGNIGIGTTDTTLNASVVSRLTICQNDGSTGLTIANATTPRLALNGNTNGSWSAYDHAAGIWTLGITQVSGYVGIGTYNPTKTLEVAGNVLFSGASRSFYIGTSGQAWSQMSFLSNQGIINTGSQVLYIQNNNNTTNLLTILNAGQVGIGTTSPIVALDVSGNYGANQISWYGGSSLRGYSYADSGGVGISDVGSGIRELIYMVSGSAYMSFYTNGVERLRLDNTGKVGIGTPSPLSTLDVSGTFRSGDETNYSEFESDGTLHFAGNATVYNNIYIPALTLKTDPNYPPTLADISGNGINWAWSFNNSNNNSLHGSFQLPPNYKVGTNIYPFINWMPATAGYNYSTVWLLDYVVVGVSGSIGSGMIASTNDFTGAPNLKKNMSSPVIQTIQGAARTINDMFMFRIRCTNNMYNNYLNGLTIYYECDTVGSRTMLTK